MSIRVAINGFGRIGRLSLRALLESKRDDFEIIAINDLGPLETNTHLFKYDSAHGIVNAEVRHDDEHMIINDHKIRYFSKENPQDLPWGALNIDIVFECTGRFVAREDSEKHLLAGAKKVLISAPGKDADITVVYGLNHHTLKADHKIVSNASCTTNCLAPVADVLNKTVGIVKGYMTSVHSYTGDQPTIDRVHRDLRRARSAGVSIIPTYSGAEKAVGLVLPELLGKLDGCALRVPTQNVSLVDLTFEAARMTTEEEINQAIIDASQGRFKGILGAYDQELVSIDFNHNPNSSSFDLTQTKVMEGNLVRVLSWYDNEWGFSNRMFDTARAMADCGY